MRILIGIDGSSQAMAGAKWVAGLPLTVDAEAIVATIIRRPAGLRAHDFLEPDRDGSVGAAAWREAEEAVQPFIDDAVAVVRVCGCSLRTLVQVGHPIEALARLAVELQADLIVVGPHGRGHIEALLLGSVTHGLLAVMPTAVLVAREPVTAPARVLLATDGSSHSVAAARYLAQLPLPVDAVVHVVTVCCDLSSLQETEERARAELAGEAAAEVVAAGGWQTSSLVRIGDAKRALLAVIEELEADLIVTGARGLGGLGGLVLGSVSQAIARSAPCSVLVVPEQSDADP